MDRLACISGFELEVSVLYLAALLNYMTGFQLHGYKGNRSSLEWILEALKYNHPPKHCSWEFLKGKMYNLKY